jgi:hypothetical protein
MSTEVISVDGLLHLGALGVVLTSGYLGIDKLHDSRSKFYDSLESTKRSVRALFDVEQNATALEVPALLRTAELYTLCYVAELRLVGIPWHIYMTSFYYHLKYIPMLKFFRRKHDRLFAALGAFLCIISFMYIVYTDLHRYHVGNDGFLYEIFFWIYFVVVLGVFITVTVAATKLRSLENTCQSLRKIINDAQVDAVKGQIKNFAQDLVD